MSAPSFSKTNPNKVADGIRFSGKNTLIKSEDGSTWRAAIADEPIDAKTDGKKMFCLRVDKSGSYFFVMIGFTAFEKFDLSKQVYFGYNDFSGCGLQLYNGQLYLPNDKQRKIIDEKKSIKAKEIIVILDH